MHVKRWIAIGTTIRRFFLAMLPVVFGVLLALMINNLNDSIKEKKTIKDLKTHVYNEINENLKICEDFIAEQEKRNAFFRIYKDSLAVFEQQGYAFSDLPFKGFRLLHVSQTAWDAAQFSGFLNRLEFDEVKLLAGIYQQQQYVLNLQKQLISVLFTKDIYNPDLMTTTFFHHKQWTEDFMGFAGSLLLNYKYYFNEFHEPSHDNNY